MDLWHGIQCIRRVVCANNMNSKRGTQFLLVSRPPALLDDVGQFLQLSLRAKQCAELGNIRVNTDHKNV